MSKTFVKRFLILICSFVFIISVFSGCSILPKEEETLAPPVVQPKRTEYDLYKVVRKDLINDLKATGNFESAREQQLFTTVSGGRLKSIDVKEMQNVKKGTVLARLDIGDMETSIQLQQNTVKKLQIQLGSLQKQYNSYKALPVGGQPSAKDMDSMKINIELMQIDLDSAKISLDSMNKKYQESLLTAPYDGIVTYIADIKEGDMVEAYKTIVTVSDPSSLQIYYKPTDNSVLKGIKSGMSASINYNGKQYEGEVAMGPDNLPKDATDKLKDAIILNVKGNISAKPGSSVDFIINIQKKTNVIAIPKKALKEYMGSKTVQVMDGDSKKQVNVVTGIENALEVEIISGLTEGQSVILN
ncbi:MAG: efflux RND transporter periplasmic adaptor subunit [Bacillota bacterium]|nr:efflux RND transporter periplasmic adaptor subunit [Bacillota bacterium]